jgi:choline-sulfatase
MTPRVSDEPTANIDLAPTLLELAGGAPCEAGRCRDVDGRSLMPILSGSGEQWPKRRPLLVELDQRPDGVQSRPRSCAFEGVRRGRWMYVEHTSSAMKGGVCEPRLSLELYDLKGDPRQLRNLAGAPEAKAIQRSLAAELSILRDCEGNVTAPEGVENPCE